MVFHDAAYRLGGLAAALGLLFSAGIALVARARGALDRPVVSAFSPATA